MPLPLTLSPSFGRKLLKLPTVDPGFPLGIRVLLRIPYLAREYRAYSVDRFVPLESLARKSSHCRWYRLVFHGNLVLDNHVDSDVHS